MSTNLERGLNLHPLHSTETDPMVQHLLGLAYELSHKRRATTPAPLEKSPTSLTNNALLRRNALPSQI